MCGTSQGPYVETAQASDWIPQGGTLGLDPAPPGERRNSPPGLTQSLGHDPAYGTGFRRTSHSPVVSRDRCMGQDDPSPPAPLPAKTRGEGSAFPAPSPRGAGRGMG